MTRVNPEALPGIRIIEAIQNLYLALEADNVDFIIKWWADGAIAFNHSFKNHSGVMMSMGK